MRNYLPKFMLVLSLALVTAVGCDKDDDDDKKDEIVEKKGLVLSGDQEVPVKTTTATGSADVAYNKTTKQFTFTLNWNGLSGDPTGAHIHGAAARGANAGIKLDFFDAFPKTASGTYSGSAVIDNIAIKEDSLLNGFYYFNIHTPTNPGGEIRGQIEF